MKKTRTHYAVINSSVTSIIFIVNTILKFLIRSIFVFYLGKTFLGVNSLFNTIVGMLSLSELGIGASIVYALYRPLSEDNHGKIKSLMKLYKKIYIIIGCIVFVLGIALLPILPYLVHVKDIDYIRNVYLLFILNSTLSYFFTYNASLLNADQKNYIITFNNFVFYVLTIFVQWIVLWKFHSFILYQLVVIVFTLMGNIILRSIVNRQYPYLKNKNCVPCSIDKNTINILFKNTIGNFMNKLGTTIVMMTDNIYITIFSGLVTVGLYNNYIIFINAANAFINQLEDSLLGSIGNLAIDEDQDKAYTVLKRNAFINYFFLFISSILFVNIIDDFISLWLGKSFKLPAITVLLIMFNYILQMYRKIPNTFISAYGLSWFTKWKVLVECLANVLFSALFLIVFDLKLNGVILGTICSTLFIVQWWEPYILFKKGLKQPVSKYYSLILYQTIILILSLILVSFVGRMFIVTNWIEFFGKVIVITAVTLLLFILFWFKNSEYRYLMTLIKNIAIKLINK